MQAPQVSRHLRAQRCPLQHGPDGLPDGLRAVPHMPAPRRRPRSPSPALPPPCHERPPGTTARPCSIGMPGTLAEIVSDPSPAVHPPRTGNPATDNAGAAPPPALGNGWAAASGTHPGQGWRAFPASGQQAGASTLDGSHHEDGQTPSCAPCLRLVSAGVGHGDAYLTQLGTSCVAQLSILPGVCPRFYQPGARHVLDRGRDQAHATLLHLNIHGDFA